MYLTWVNMNYTRDLQKVLITVAFSSPDAEEPLERTDILLYGSREHFEWTLLVLSDRAPCKLTSSLSMFFMFCFKIWSWKAFIEMPTFAKLFLYKGNSHSPVTGDIFHFHVCHYYYFLLFRNYLTTGNYTWKTFSLNYLQELFRKKGSSIKETNDLFWLHIECWTTFGEIIFMPATWTWNTWTRRTQTKCSLDDKHLKFSSRLPLES